MEPARSLAITFSQTSALAPGFARSSVSSASPAVRSFWLWQVMQYLSRTARGSEDVVAWMEPGGGVCLAWTLDNVTAREPLTKSAEIDAPLTVGQFSSIP